jgi:hypothetical protein
MPNKPRFTYSNVVSTLALFLALSGGVAFAASKIHTRDIAKRAITSGKLAVGAVRSNQIADGAVSAKQIGAGAVSSSKIGAGSVAPSNLQFPTYFAASPLGGSLVVPASELVAYPLSDSTWLQKPGQLNVVFGAAAATLAYDGSGSGSCRAFFEINLNGRQVGGGELSTDSTALEPVEQTVGAQPEIDPVAPVQNKLTARIGSNGDCEQGSAVNSTRFRVLDFG